MSELPDNLPISTAFDPFADDLFVETYLFRADFNLVTSEIGLLFGTWTGLAHDVPDNISLLSCKGTLEYGWKVENWGRPAVPHWWKVVGQRFLAPNDMPRMEIDNTPPIPGGLVLPIPGMLEESRYRHEFSLNPNAALVVAFDSAAYYFGTQEGIEDDVTFRPDQPVEWHQVVYWP